MIKTVITDVNTGTSGPKEHRVVIGGQDPNDKTKMVRKGVDAELIAVGGVACHVFTKGRKIAFISEAIAEDGRVQNGLHAVMTQASSTLTSGKNTIRHASDGLKEAIPIALHTSFSIVKQGLTDSLRKSTGIGIKSLRRGSWVESKDLTRFTSTPARLSAKWKGLSAHLLVDKTLLKAGLMISEPLLERGEPSGHAIRRSVRTDRKDKDNLTNFRTKASRKSAPINSNRFEIGTLYQNCKLDSGSRHEVIGSHVGLWLHILFAQREQSNILKLFTHERRVMHHNGCVALSGVRDGRLWEIFKRKSRDGDDKTLSTGDLQNILKLITLDESNAMSVKANIGQRNVGQVRLKLHVVLPPASRTMLHASA
ncbi:hypothetical protein AK812_SmicGene36931 [Symbiodinium microadriaticum]|uniref:Uncharacterized protein n=1 Tax=Symbiodinium microadriaticum TaxID=2951 RepID=A0A1Q9CHJ9_SYMMI|nr:hypothetical protein AK812_SmicGene36931 [Symbiodinium microadriaticum]CAE7535581.1 unnamed protein product [Symbiodinium microadriaticum]CAE7808560.1 unnamed protein product [Symbiodinium sp. KB8]